MRRHSKAWDAVGLVLLIIGGVLLPLLGWAIGLVIVWRSPRWSTAQKWVGSLVFPALILSSPILFAATARGCTSQACVADGAGRGPLLAVLVGVAAVVVLAGSWMARQLVRSD